MAGWKAVGVVVEGQPIEVQGINPWDHEWRRTASEPVELPHPSHPRQRHRLTVYEVESAGRVVTFAAGELSANVWGFYVPDPRPWGGGRIGPQDVTVPEPARRTG